MEANHILLFIAVASSLLVMVQSIRTRDIRSRAAAGFVLIASAVAWLIARPIAGWISGIVWYALLFLPAFLRNRRRRRVDGFRRRIEITPAVLTFALANVAAFFIEILFGGPTNSFTLDRLGWLDTDLVLYGHQYWRLVTALFLHYGILHLLVNVFALVVLGPALEQQIGSVAFAICYLLSGIGASLAVVVLVKARFLSPVELVGASGCIMGVAGAWAGDLLRNRHLPFAEQRLRNIIVIVLLQIVFDIVTPRVSMSAHLGGLVTGFLVGLLVPRLPKLRHVIRFS